LNGAIDFFKGHPAEPIVRALVERVQQAERRANFEEMRAASEAIEQDGPRAKLDKVREWATSPSPMHDVRETEGYWQAQHEVRAILDDKE